MQKPAHPAAFSATNYDFTPYPLRKNWIGGE